MAFKVNYGLKKAERDRAKKAKKEAKARERDSGAAPAGGHDEAGNPAPVDDTGIDDDASAETTNPAAGV